MSLTQAIINGISTYHATPGDKQNEEIRAAFQSIFDGHGLDMTGATDQSTEVQALFDALSSGDIIEFTSGTILITTQVNISAGITIVGNETTFKTTGNIKIFNVNSDNVNITGCNFLGTDNVAHTVQYGVYVNDKRIFKFQDCTFTDLYHGVYFGSTLGTPSFALSSILSCHFTNGTYGILGGTRGEYVNINDCRIFGNTTGIEFIGGNILIDGCQIVGGGTGIKIGTGTNDSHGIVSNCLINHNTTYSVFVDSIVNGHRFVDCNLIQGTLYLKDCAAVSFIGCRIDQDAINFESATGTVMGSNRHSTSYTNTVDKEFNGDPASVIVTYNNYNMDGTAYVGI